MSVDYHKQLEFISLLKEITKSYREIIEDFQQQLKKLNIEKAMGQQPVSKN
jgi:hypothetical protein